MAVELVAHSDVGASALSPDLVAPVVLLVVLLRARRPQDRWALGAAVAALLVAALPPVHTAAETSVTAHMLQHLVLLLVVAPLLGVVAARAPSRLRGRKGLGAAARLAVAPPAAPLVAGTVHTLLVVALHAPVPYDAGLATWWVHGLQHAAMVGSGAWWWATVVHHSARRVPVVSLASIAVAATVGAVVGVLMMFAPRPLYAHGDLTDQQAGGAIMAGAMGLVLGGTALRLGARALQHLGGPARVRVPFAAHSERGAGRGVAAVTMAGLAATALVAMALTGGVGPAAAQAVGEDPGDPLTLGRDLYGRDCASCHGADAAGSFRGTSLQEVGTASVTYVLETGRMPINRPDDAIRRSQPAYDQTEIDALVAYLGTLVDGPEAHRPQLEAASMARGGEQYRLHCAACHGAEGIGGALALVDPTPPVLDATPADVANAVVAGPGAMPSFGATFDEEGLADLAAYVDHLQDPEGPGISVPGGRVGEGLVAWVVGVGALLVGAAWIGRRA